MTVQHFRISPDGDTVDAYVPVGPHAIEFYPDGMLKEKRWFGYSGEVIRKVAVNQLTPRKIGVVHYRNESEETVETWFSYQFNQLGLIEKSVESRGYGHLEKTEFVYDGTRLQERLVYEKDALLSHFKYEYVDSQNQWAVKKEFNSSGALVDSKSQIFDDKNRIVRFKTTDSEEGEIEDRTFTYFDDGTRITVVKLNMGSYQGLLRVDSTFETFLNDLPIERLKYDEQSELTKQTKWSYENGNLSFKLNLDGNSDTLSFTTYSYPCYGRVIEKEYNSNASLLKTLETDTDSEGRHVYFCESKPMIEKSFHFKYGKNDNVIETIKRELNEADLLDVSMLEKRTIQYYEP